MLLILKAKFPMPFDYKIAGFILRQAYNHDTLVTKYKRRPISA